MKEPQHPGWFASRRWAGLALAALVTVGVLYFADRGERSAPAVDGALLPGSAPASTANERASLPPDTSGGSADARQALTPEPVDRAEPGALLARGPSSPLLHLRTTRSGQPIGGIAVELFLTDPVPGMAFLRRGVTGDDGKCVFDLTELDQDVLVTARITEPGYQQRTGTYAWKPGRTQQSDLRLIVSPGATVRGRVVDGGGQAVSGEIGFRTWANDEPPRTSEQFFFLRRGPQSPVRFHDGTFEVHVHAAGFGAVFADCGAAGTGQLGEVRVDLMNPPQDLLVHVGGGGVLRGRIVDGRGDGIAGRRLSVSVAEHDDSESAAPSDANGHATARARTDEDGYFEARGLRPARYDVRAARPGLADGFPALLTPEPVLADGVPFEVRWLRPHLHVRMLDRVSERLSKGQDVVVEGQRIRFVFTWPEWPQLIVTELDAQGTGARSFQASVDSQGVVTVDVLDGRDYLVSAVGGDFDGPGQVVRVPLGSERVDVILQAPVESLLGELDVRVFAGGRVLESGEFDLTFESLATGLTLRSSPRLSYVEDSSATTPNTWHLKVPAGRYRLAASGSTVVGVFGAALRPRTLGRVERVVTVRAGETVSARLDLEPGGMLEVQIIGKAGPEDDAVFESRSAGFWVPAKHLGQSADRLRLHVLATGRDSEPVYRADPDGAFRLRGFWSFGSTEVSSMLSAGNYELIGTSLGGREARVRVSILKGATTPVVLRFDSD